MYVNGRYVAWKMSKTHVFDQRACVVKMMADAEYLGMEIECRHWIKAPFCEGIGIGDVIDLETSERDR